MTTKKHDSIIKNDLNVTAYLYGDTIEMTTACGPSYQKTQKHDKNRYIDLETGELKYYEKNSTLRIDNIDVIKKTMKKLRRLITHNFEGGKNQLWITLTFSEEVTDFKIASKHYKQFMKRLRKKYSNLEYVSVIEPHESGRWHFHVLLKDSENKRLHINNNELNNFWKKGHTKTKRLRKTDKVGNYLISYLSDLKLDDGKSTVKGARLHFYPKGIRIYRRSKGIENPLVFKDTKENILDLYHIKGKSPDYSKATTYQKRNGEPQTYYTEFYDEIKKKPRRPKQVTSSKNN